MLDSLAARAHGVRIFVEPRLNGFDNMLVFPAFDPALGTRRAFGLQWTGFAGARPIVAELLSVLLACKAILEFLAGRTTIYVFSGQIDKILLAVLHRALLRTRDVAPRCPPLGLALRKVRSHHMG